MYISSVVDGIVQFYSEPIVQSFLKVCLTIDTVIYNLISWLYSVFMTIAKARVFTAETVRPFLDRIYLIVGIVALFFAAYTFMTIIVNPENLTKGNSSPAKMIRNIILGILSITFIPTIFNFAYSVQGAALDQNVIGKLFISGSDKLMDDSENNLNSFGVTLFEASYYVKTNTAADAKTIESTKTCYANAHNYAMSYNDVSLYGSCLSGVQDGAIQYNFILAGVIGIIVCYIFFVYCFDLGLRAIKLAFLQIISPLPCLLLMVPGQDKVFKSWLKDTLKTFFEVFMKIFIVVFCVYIIQLLREWFDVNQAQVFPGVSLAVVNFAKIFIFLGVIMFMKKAPKLIEDLFGIKTDPKAFSLKQRLADSGLAGAFNTTVGTVGGLIASNIANKKAGKSRLDSLLENGKISKNDYNKQMAKLNSKNPFTKEGLLGAYYGSRGGIKGIGTAYNNAYDMQLYKANGLSGKDVAGNLLRDNFGIQSYYDEQLKESKIKNDAIASVANKKSASYRQSVANEVNKTGSKFDNKIEANKNMDKSVKTADEYIDSQTRKAGSTYTKQGTTLDYDAATDTFRVGIKDMNRAELEKNYADMYQHLVDQGLSSDLALEVAAKVKDGDYSFFANCAGVSVWRGNSQLTAASTPADLSSLASSIKTTYSLDSLKDAVASIKNSFYTDSIDPATGDAEFKRLLTEIQKAGDNDNVGKAVIRFKRTVQPNGTVVLDRDPTTGDLIRAAEWEEGIALEADESSNPLLSAADKAAISTWFSNPTNKASYTFNASADLASAAAFFNLQKSMKNFASNIEAQKAAELANINVTIDTFNDATGAVTGTEVKSVNQVLGMIERENKISEQAQKSQKLTADALQGIKVADEAVKKHRANSKRQKPNGGGGGH